MKTALDKLDDTEINGRRIRLVEDKHNKKRRRYVAHIEYTDELLFLQSAFDLAHRFLSMYKIKFSSYTRVEK